MKANSSKQIRHKIEKVNTLKNNFEKAIKKCYGEEDDIKLTKCKSTVHVDFVGECDEYLVYDEKEDGYTKTFRFAAQEYVKEGKSYIKVVSIIAAGGESDI